MSLDNGARSEPYGPDRPHIPSVLGCRRRPDPGARAGLRGLSSAGRATESHSVGHRFDPDRLHQILADARLWRSLIQVFVGAAFGATGSTSGAEGEASKAARASDGALAQLGERVLCKHEVTGSIPVGSTSSLGANRPLGIGVGSSGG